MPEVTAEVKIDIDVYCGDCGDGLCNISDGGDGEVTVGPCPKCIESAKDEARSEAYDTGYEDAKFKYEVD